MQGLTGVFSFFIPHTLAACDSLLAALKSVAMHGNTVGLLWVDMLNILPPELRSQIYSYVFSTSDEGLIVLRAARGGDWAGDMGLPAFTVLLQNSRYRCHRRKPNTQEKWPNLVEEAFHKGDTKPELDVQMLILCRLALRWTDACHHKLSRKEIISKVIYDYTGQFRDRKQISSHVQKLKRISSHVLEVPDRPTEQIVGAAAELREANMEDREIQALSKPQNRPKRILPDGPTHSLFHEISHFAPLNDRELSLQLARPLGNNFLALSVVNRFCRSEVMQYIEDHLFFDFTWDGGALHPFCKHINPIHRRQLNQIAIEFVDGHAPDVFSPPSSFGIYLSNNLPNLRTIFLNLIPRNPVHNDGHWGQQTEDFLSNLGDLTATIILNLRWKDDCDYFEDKYVGIRGWRCIQPSEVQEVSGLR